jgi:3alpha(or 20beta)-hydroxysteroid dehydrogenase
LTRRRATNKLRLTAREDDMGRLDGKVALITGAAQNQGEAQARRFAAEGAKVVVTDIQDERGRAVAASLGDKAVWRRLDVTKSADWAAAVAFAVESFGKLNVLINNAGIFPNVKMEEMGEDQFMQVVRVNQLGCWLGMKAVVEAMRAAGGGAIVNTASVAGLAGLPGLSAYVGSKHAVRGLSKTAAIELGQYGIRVNSVYPGAVVGDEVPAGVTPEMLAEMFARRPIPRAGQVEDIANAMVFLASDESAYCTGTEVLVDGGWLAGAAGSS